MSKTEAIRKLNDDLRAAVTRPSLLAGKGSVVMTVGIQMLVERPGRLSQLLEAIKTHDTFTQDNDPHGEHDFGSLEIFGDRVFWKIDYYNKATSEGSEDPSDPSKTHRVLTIMLASEY